MDRNLGALDDKYHSASQNMSKYYQFGRKDPFNSDIYCWAYDSDTFIPTKTSAANGARTYMTGASVSDEYATGGMNVPFAVNHPFVFFNDGAIWTTGDVFSQNGVVWCDPKNTLNLENEEGGTNASKSLFDPCPGGWRIPNSGCFSGFRGDNNTSATGDTSMNCQWGVESDDNGRSRGNGRTYFPLGYLNERGNSNPQTAFFPAGGVLTGNVLGCRQDGAYLFLEMSSDSITGTNIFLMNNVISKTYSDGRTTRRKGSACNIRCIKE